MYSIRDFRKNLRVAFLEASKQPVYIEKYGQIFMLRLTPYVRNPVVELKTLQIKQRTRLPNESI